ncbi:amidohydrolase [Clostridium sp. D2Q-14]|uniref:amidohydrolase n=1 Tax=Anaeromonas gelatinilytica TaxID=2683194 RepID=UPI00193C5CF9|nr:amidohydrolase [Anaeromonas gelatinilytica]MBS4534359.1 amidohydrolase [Anaeromonas gelatinilytica]
MDKIFINGNIITMDKNSKGEALYIKNNIIDKVGSNEEILKLNNENVEIIDLQNKTLLPGFIDSHMHLLDYGKSLQKCDLRGVKSISELIERLKKFVEKNDFTSNDWILGEGWNHDQFEEKRLPTKEDLDKVSTKISIAISRTCLHLIVVNSKALDISNIKAPISKMKDGQVDVDSNGKPNGIIRENAIGLINKNIPTPSKEDIKRMIIDGGKNTLAKGITSIHSDDLKSIPGLDFKDIIKIYEELAENNELPVRIYEQCRVTSMEELNDFIDNGFNDYKGNDFFKLGPIKLFTDGSLGSRTAALREPYSDDPSTKGISIYNQKELDELIINSHNLGRSVAVHCIGDKSMEMALNSIEKAQEKNPRNDIRHGIVHAQITDNEIMDKFKSLDVLAYVQPIFLNYDVHVVDNRIGKKRAKTSYNWKTMMDKGIILGFGSDSPVETFDVMKGIYSAVTRKDLEGKPKEGWLKEQCISVYDSIYNYTINGAYAEFKEDIKGSITKGKVADLVVLSEDIFNINPNDIKNVEVEMTFINGKLKYKK